jgi:hypothetical protein
MLLALLAFAVFHHTLTLTLGFVAFFVHSSKV